MVGVRKVLPDARGTGGCLVGVDGGAAVVMEKGQGNAILNGTKCRKRSGLVQRLRKKS